MFRPPLERAYFYTLWKCPVLKIIMFYTELEGKKNNENNETITVLPSFPPPPVFPNY